MAVGSSFAALQSLMMSETDDDDSNSESHDEREKPQNLRRRRRRSGRNRLDGRKPALALSARSDPLSHKRSAPLIEMRGSIENHPCRILVDCGASCNYVSQRIVNRYQLTRQNFYPPLTIELADGSQSKADEELIQHRVTMLGFDGAVDLVITALNQYDVILGIPWFKKYQPVIDWQQGMIMQVVGEEADIGENGARLDERRGEEQRRSSPSDHVTSSSPSDHVTSSSRAVHRWSHSRLPQSTQLSELQLLYTPTDGAESANAVSPGSTAPCSSSRWTSCLVIEGESNDQPSQVFLCSDTIGEATDQDGVEVKIPQAPTWLQSTLDRYKDVLSASGVSSLPPSREEDHRIELVNGAKPIKCKSFPLSAKHQDVIKKDS